MVTKLNIDRKMFDHPEHFDDEIREYRTSNRYIPTKLESQLFELAGHRCTICSAPWMEIHHIEELATGGLTEFDNLIVLCPNCHTRVHAEGIPTKEELRHYKLKQEIAYELPVLSRLTEPENQFVRELAALDIAKRLAFSKRELFVLDAKDQEEAVSDARERIGFYHLQEFGMVSVDQEHAITLADGKISVALRVRLTGKGQKWIAYLIAASRLPTEN